MSPVRQCLLWVSSLCRSTSLACLSTRVSMCPKCAGVIVPLDGLRHAQHSYALAFLDCLCKHLIPFMGIDGLLAIWLALCLPSLLPSLCLFCYLLSRLIHISIHLHPFSLVHVLVICPAPPLLSLSWSALYSNAWVLPLLSIVQPLISSHSLGPHQTASDLSGSP